MKFHLSQFLQNQTLNNITYVTGYYVYEWRDCNQVFYVGMGTNRRAWDDHLPLPENRRRTAANFMVNIYRDSLTKAQAHLLERHHTYSLTKRGIILLNARIPNPYSIHNRK